MSVAFPEPRNTASSELENSFLFFFFLSKFSSLVSVLRESVLCHFYTDWSNVSPHLPVTELLLF